MQGDTCHPQRLGCRRGRQPLAQASAPSPVSVACALGQRYLTCHRELLHRGMPRLLGSCGSPAAPRGRWDRGICSTAGPSCTTLSGTAGTRSGKRAPAPQLPCSEPGAMGSFWTLV